MDNYISGRGPVKLGHRRLETTAHYLRIATITVCATASPFDLLPRPVPAGTSPAD